MFYITLEKTGRNNQR